MPIPNGSFSMVDKFRVEVVGNLADDQDGQGYDLLRIEQGK